MAEDWTTRINKETDARLEAFRKTNEAAEARIRENRLSDEARARRTGTDRRGWPTNGR